MEKLFIQYKEAKQLQDLGFNEPCFAFFSKGKLFQVSPSIYVSEEWSTIKNSDLKESNEETYFNNEFITCPTWDQAFQWFASPENMYRVIETWIQPYLSPQPRQYEAMYWRRGVTESIGKYSSNLEAKQASLEKLLEFAQEEFINKNLQG